MFAVCAGPDIAPETAPKTKEQIISELASEIRTDNMTSGRAMIAAQQILLLSCSTGAVADEGYCFAEELANALGAAVWAPNDLLMVNKDGTFYIGLDGSGRIVDFKPNERGRMR